MKGIDIRNPAILVIEDEPTQRHLLKGQLEDLGYPVITAVDGIEGMAELDQNNHIRIVITDLEMPSVDGFEVIKRIRENESQYTYLMVVTNLNNKEALLRALSLGVDDYVHKPVLKEELALRVKSAKHLLRLEDHDNLVASLASFAAVQSGELDVHLKRTKEYCCAIARDLMDYNPDLGLTEEIIVDLGNICVMHDIGKICIPDGLSQKGGNYTAKEQQTIEEHTTLGAQMFQELYKKASSSFLQLGYEMVLNHHEKWDGTGYPNGVKGEEIPLSARILALADTYDKIRSRQPFKDPFPASYAENVIASERDKSFDSVIVDAFLRQKEMFVIIHDKFPENV